MSYTNAWYIGNSELDAAPACFCASLRSVPSVLQRGLIVAATWSWRALAQALRPLVVVDARARRPAAATPVLDCSALTIAVGRGLASGVDAHAVIDPGETSGSDVGYVVEASQAGRFMTTHRIGQRVRAGDVVGQIGVQAVVANGPGVLRGLSARGARIASGDVVLEIDPRGDPALCFGIAADARRIAADALRLVDETVAAH
jgi:xanthine dehydrogenase accessory factor